mmetsp:Transcript_26236/g.54796  ORF Transcript_26236/g.54796 Transcript_26236/m.54796 type:complete len:284 (+) Transcript_26236:1265-2116(+)
MKHLFRASMTLILLFLIVGGCFVARLVGEFHPLPFIYSSSLVLGVLVGLPASALPNGHGVHGTVRAVKGGIVHVLADVVDGAAGAYAIDEFEDVERRRRIIVKLNGLHGKGANLAILVEEVTLGNAPRLGTHGPEVILVPVRGIVRPRASVVIHGPLRELIVTIASIQTRIAALTVVRARGIARDAVITHASLGALEEVVQSYNVTDAMAHFGSPEVTKEVSLVLVGVVLAGVVVEVRVVCVAIASGCGMVVFVGGALDAGAGCELEVIVGDAAGGGGGSQEC